MGEGLERFRGIMTGVPEPQDPGGRLLYPGLPAGELAIIETLAASEEDLSRQILAKRTELTGEEVVAALEHLIALGYAIQVEGMEGSVYRAVGRPLGR